MEGVCSTCASHDLENNCASGVENLDVKAPRVVMGTDCALGKRTTTRWLRDACQAEGLKTELIYTGQTGWMQSTHDYGFILDATPNDFVSGELESAIVRCDRELAPQLILIEGQSALRIRVDLWSGIPSSAQAKGVILQHAPGRAAKTTSCWPMILRMTSRSFHYGSKCRCNS